MTGPVVSSRPVPCLHSRSALLVRIYIEYLWCLSQYRPCCAVLLPRPFCMPPSCRCDWQSALHSRTRDGGRSESVSFNWVSYVENFDERDCVCLVLGAVFGADRLSRSRCCCGVHSWQARLCREPLLLWKVLPVHSRLVWVPRGEAHLSHDIFALSYKWLSMLNCVVAIILLYIRWWSHWCHMIVTWHSSVPQTKDTFARRWTSMVTAKGHRMEVRDVHTVLWLAL